MFKANRWGARSRSATNSCKLRRSVPEKVGVVKVVKAGNYLLTKKLWVPRVQPTNEAERRANNDSGRELIARPSSTFRHLFEVSKVLRLENMIWALVPTPCRSSLALSSTTSEAVCRKWVPATWKVTAALRRSMTTGNALWCAKWPAEARPILMPSSRQG